MALSIGFRIFSLLPSCYSSYGALNFYPGGTFTHCSCQPSLDAHFTGHIARAVSIPVMADIDTGGGNALNAASITERLLEMGVAGVNIEDQVFPKRCGHMEGKQVVPADEMAGKVRAMVDVRRRLGKDIVINAQTDSYAVHGLREAIFRANLYLDSGADLVFIDGIGTRLDIERAVSEIHGLLSVNLMDGVTGVKTELVSIPELAAMGVARVLSLI